MARLVDDRLREMGRKRLEAAAARADDEPLPPVDGGGSFEEACKLYRIRTKQRGLVTFDPSRWHVEQRRFNTERTGRDIVVKPRAVGMSTLEILRGFNQSTTRESWNTRVVIHDTDLADDLFQIVHIAYSSMRDAGRVVSPRFSRTRELYFAELGSGISVQPAGATLKAAVKKGRSGTIHRLHATEVAFWEHPRDTMTGLLGAVPANGEILIESTANGPQGFFYEEVQTAIAGESEYKLHFFPWFVHTSYRSPLPEDFDPASRDEWEEKLREHGCDDEQIAWWRGKVRLLTLEKALQEFPESIDTCFRYSGSEWIPAETLDKAAKAARDPLEVVDVRVDGRLLGELHVYRKPASQAEGFIGGCDVAEGVEKDGSATSFLNDRSAEVCGTFWRNEIEPGDYGRALDFCGRYFNTALLAVERNNHGHATLSTLRDLNYPNIYHSEDERPGWVTSPKTRPVMYDDGWTAVRDGDLVTPDRGTLGEMRTLARDARGRPGARSGAHDDRWTALIIAWQVFQQTRVGGGVVAPEHNEPDADQLSRYM